MVKRIIVTGSVSGNISYYYNQELGDVKEGGILGIRPPVLPALSKVEGSKRSASKWEFWGSEFWGSGQEFGNTRPDQLLLHITLLIAELVRFRKSAISD